MTKTLNHINRIKSLEEIREAIENKFEKEWKVAELEVYKNQHEKKMTQFEEQLKELAESQYKQIETLEGKKYRRKKRLRKTEDEDEKAKLTTEIEDIDTQIATLNGEIKQIAKENKIGSKSLNRLIKKEKQLIETIESEQNKLESKIVAMEPVGKSVEYKGAGYYVVHVFGKEVRFVEVQSEEEFKTVHNLILSNVLSIRKIDQSIYDAWQKTCEVCKKLEMSPGELFALAEVKGGFSEQLSEDVRAELTAFAKAYGSISVSLAGIFMEIGAGTEVNVYIGTDTIGYNAKLYAKAKAGVYVSLAGIEACAGGEAGAEHAIKFTPPAIGKYEIEVNGKFKAYGKAEAKALIKLTGGGAKAAVALGLAANLEGILKYESKAVGSIEVEGAFEIELGVGAVAKIDLKIGNLDTDGDVPMRVFEVGVEIGVEAIVGASVILKGTVKIADHLVQTAKKEIKKKLQELIKEAILKLTNEKVLAILIEMKDEIDHYASKITSVLGHQRNNITNFLDKGIIAMQTEHKNKVKLGFERHENKLNRYKKHVEESIAALEKKIADLGDNITMDETEIDLLIKGSEDESFRALVKEMYRGEPRKVRDLIIELQKYVVKYNTRIEKYMEFINSEFLLYAERIEKHYEMAITIIEEFKEMEDTTDEERQETREEINKKLEKINSLITTFNLIAETKEDVLAKAQAFSNDEEVDVDSEEIATEIRRTYRRLNKQINQLIAMVGEIKTSLR